MITCTNCGSANPVGTNFCSQCGTSLVAATPPSGETKKIRVGREVDNDICVPAQYGQVSRYHATIYVKSGGQLSVEDLGTSNGTFVNNTPVTGPTALNLNDEVRFGSYVLDMALVRAQMGSASPPEVGSPFRPPSVPAPQPGRMEPTQTLGYSTGAIAPWRSSVMNLCAAFFVALMLIPMIPEGRDGKSSFLQLAMEDDAPGEFKLWVYGTLAAAVACFAFAGSQHPRNKAGWALIGLNAPLWYLILDNMDFMEEVMQEMGEETGNLMSQGFLSWGFFVALGAFLLMWSHRQRDQFVRNGIGVSAGGYVLTGWLMPNDAMKDVTGESNPFMAQLEILGNVEGGLVVPVLMGFIPLVVAVWSLRMLSVDPPGEYTWQKPQQMAWLLASYLPLTLLAWIIFMPSEMKEGLNSEAMMMLFAYMGLIFVYLLSPMAGFALLGLPEEEGESA